ncbi:hypothetical protein F0U61_32470 [Archangium violaceum]|uniref:hypothetical protein n=1 Tax=Archangium violaceum TaxID=83451 RepID=UPI002B291C77|nr:hypothetical protein F0U61_32470 [Archangium violaceum]
MHRTDAPGNVAGMYDGGDPMMPREATFISATHMNALQEEIIGPIEAAGIALDKADNNQLHKALSATYGRLEGGNTWMGSQAFDDGLSASGAVSFSGGVTFSSFSPTFNKGPRVGPGEDYGFTVARSFSTYINATQFACNVATGTTGGPVMTINSLNGRPVWRAGDSNSAELACIVHLPEGATLTAIRWHVASLGGTQTQTVYPNAYLMSQNVGSNTETQMQLHVPGSPGSTFTVAGSSGLAWYTMPLQTGPFVMPASGYLHIGLTLSPSINGAGNGLNVRGVRVEYTITALRPPV